MAVRDLKIGIAWDVNTRELLRANERTDEYTESVRDGQQEVRNLEQRVSRSGRSIQQDMGRVEESAGSADQEIRGIHDPQVNSTQAQSELGNVEQAAEQADAQVRQETTANVNGSQAVRRLGNVEQAAQQADAEVEKQSTADVDTSQANRKLDNLKEKANEVGTLIGGIGGGVSGAAMFQDLQSLEQLPREFEASLGVDESTAEDLKDQVASIWADIPNMTQESSAEAVASVVRQFDVTGDRAGDMAEKVALLNDQTGADFNEIARNARLMTDRFDDIESSEEAFNMLTGASRDLDPETFSELTDQVEEYGGNIADAGLSGEDFFAAMVDGGEESRRVMDRLGDSLSAEMIPNIRDGEEATMDMLAELGNSEEQAEDWRDAIVKGGDEGNDAIKEILGSLSDIEDQGEQSAAGGELLGEIYREQQAEISPILDDLSGDIEGVGDDAEELERRNEGALNGMTRAWRGAVNEIDEHTNGMASSFTSTVGNAMPIAIGSFVGSGGIGRMIGSLRNSNSWLRRSMGVAGRWGSRIFGLTNPIGWFSQAMIGAGITAVSNWDTIMESAKQGESTFESVFRGIWTWGDLFINDVIGMMNNLIGVMNSVPDWVPILGKDIPKLEHQFDVLGEDTEGYIGDANAGVGNSSPPTNSAVGSPGGASSYTPSSSVGNVSGSSGYTDIVPDIGNQLGEGGEVKGNSNTVAMIGEKSHDEVVAPLTERVYRRMGEGIKAASTDTPSSNQPVSQDINFNPTVNIYSTGNVSIQEERTVKSWVKEALDEQWENFQIVNPMPIER